MEEVRFEPGNREAWGKERGKGEEGREERGSIVCMIPSLQPRTGLPRARARPTRIGKQGREDGPRVVRR